jgi:hypothetical protein
MFPIAHAYLMERLFPHPTPDLYLGCVWPDMLFNGPLTHHQTHREGISLLKFARHDVPDIIPFIRAALTHMADPHGFDWFSDEAYDAGAERGYAFERARPFVDEVIAATHVAPELGLWKAHNFVEMSFEVALGDRYPHLGLEVASACHDVDLVRQVTEPLAFHFKQDAKALASNIMKFPSTVALDRPTSIDLATTYALQLAFKHGVTDADIPAMASIIDRVWDSIASDREVFLEHCVHEVAKALEQ